MRSKVAAVFLACSLIGLAATSDALAGPKGQGHGRGHDAGSSDVPELSLAGAGAAAAIVLGGILVLSNRRRSSRKR
jgi:hypothetical protein